MDRDERVTLWACAFYVVCDGLPKVLSLIERLAQ
jgi:hypothetical protein